MEKKANGSPVVKLVAALIVAAAFWALDRFVVHHCILQVVAMAAIVLFCAWLIGLILGAFKPASHRAKTVLTLHGIHVIGIDDRLHGGTVERSIGIDSDLAGGIRDLLDAYKYFHLSRPPLYSPMLLEITTRWISEVPS